MASINNSVPDTPIPILIESLCDVVPNKKRVDQDFLTLLKCLEDKPKECTPFKSKIIQHVQVHSLDNPNVNQRLLASCYAKATLLFRQTPNKTEGSLGAWKSGLSGELMNLEENLDQLYKTLGVSSNNIIGRGPTNEDDDLGSRGKLTEANTEFESIINDHLIRINSAAHNICALISVQTDFDLPLPLFILLKLATKIGLIRWKDYRKRPNGLIRSHVYSLTPYLIDINLMMFQSIIVVLGTDIIPFTPFINQTLLRILEWTRTSNLMKHDENLYHSLRSKLFRKISFIAEQLSLNINFEPQLLKALLEVEIVDNLNELITSTSLSNTSLKDIHAVDALSCLENLIIVYSDFLDVSTENKIKSLVIQTCIKIYRDFEASSTSLVLRRQLLQLLQIIANQPYATSTTEISHHIFELASKVECDPVIRSVARKCLKVGLAHRPTIVTQYDVYDCYSRPMLVASSTPTAVQHEPPPAIQNEPVESEIEKEAPIQVDEIAEPIKEPSKIKESESAESEVEKEAPSQVNEIAEPIKEPCEIKENEPAESEVEREAPSQVNEIAEPIKEPSKIKENHEGDENEILSYMSYFVEKLA